MLPQEIIRKKRDGQALSEKEISAIVSGMTDGTFSESQLAAFAMAVYFQGMSMDECIALTGNMMKSGQMLTWDDLKLDGPVVDKHSTGGVGDKVSLILAPIVAACGVYNPMVSGRGLGHTGGTLDKLESIPGYNTHPDNSLFRRTVKEVGCAIIGQTEDLAPADKLFYSVRDVTATIESVPLITASILSKKLAAGLDGLVMDVKTGNGAFANNLGFANEIAKSIIHVSNNFGVRTSVFITDMNQPLGRTVGNALEVREAVNYLTGVDRDPRLHDVVISIASEMLAIGGLAETKKEGIEKVNEVLDNGKAAESFGKMVLTLGGPENFLEEVKSYLPEAPVIKPIPSEHTGFVSGINTRNVGLAVVELGGGRKNVTDGIDHSVGLSQVVGISEKVEAAQPLALVHAQNEDQANQTIETIRNSYSISDSNVEPNPIILYLLN